MFDNILKKMKREACGHIICGNEIGSNQLTEAGEIPKKFKTVLLMNSSRTFFQYIH